MLMPKKKKSDNWQHDCLEKEKNIKRSKKKKGQRYWQRCCPKKKGQHYCRRKREERKKIQLKLRVFV